MTDFTPSDLRALLEKATPAPWVRDADACIVETNGTTIAICVYGLKSRTNTDHNAALIVAAVNALPKLLDAVEQGAAAFEVAALHKIELRELADQRDKLVEALRKYGNHMAYCATFDPIELRACNCGLDAVLSLVRGDGQ